VNIESFASEHRLKLRRNADDDNQTCILGKSGQIYEYSDTELGVSFMPGLENGRGVGRWTPKTWGNFRRKAGELGMTVRQNGDSEGSLSFNPKNDDQAKLALQIARPRQRKQLSPKHLVTLRANIAKAREIRAEA
jgi:hypothetical protein